MSAQSKKVIVNYDRVHDVLYVSIGVPKPSYCDDDIEGVLIRRALDSNRLSGVTIMDFSKKDREQLSRIIPFKVDVNDLYAHVSQ